MTINYTEEIERFPIAIELHDNYRDLLLTHVTRDWRFPIWTGSLDNKHHYGQGGLAKHTFEVIKLAFQTKETLGITDIDDLELFFSCLYHDVGKLYDYEPIDDMLSEWRGTNHKRMIHHISRSGIIWSNEVNKYPILSNKYHDNVLHAILSHHGRRDWGSPVSPKSKVAWLLHLCDNISARMDDCDRVDIRD